MNLKSNEWFQFTCLLPEHFPVGGKYRGSQNAITRVVVENLTIKLYTREEEMWRCPINVSEFKVYGLSLFHMINNFY